MVRYKRLIFAPVITTTNKFNSMKKLVGIIVIALSVMSCTPVPITMRTANPYGGADVKGTWFMDVVNQHPTNVYNKTDNVNIKFNPVNEELLINGVKYQVNDFNDYSISYVDADDMIMVIEFNIGYVWQDGKTQTKFRIYQDGEENHNYTVYTYNN